MAHSGLSDWCSYTLPFAYSYVQFHHWGVGFLRYYELKQFPNFVLAAPMVAICVCATLHYASENKMHFLCLGLSQEKFYKKYDEEMIEDNVANHGFYSRKCLVYIFHMAFLVVFGVFCIHVQVCILHIVDVKLYT